MGIYLNPGYENFRRTLAADIYVDKTMMIRELNRFIDKGNNYVCVSRPRRFGKTIASEMISAYYSKNQNSAQLFEGLKIHEDPCFFDKLNQYHVIKLDMNSEYMGNTDKNRIFKRLTEEIKKEFRAEFGQVELEPEDSLAQCIQRVYAATGETFIIIMDEYDVFVREKVSEGLFDEFLTFLNSLFKSATLRPAISLAYLTGILPIVRDQIQSKLNNFEEYTVLNARSLVGYIGFTAEEVKNLCSEYGMNYEECKNWYDGYSQRGLEIYNPQSVVKCMLESFYDNYWGKTSTYKVISDYISKNFEGTKEAVIRMLAGENVDVNVTGYLNTMDSFHTKDDVFTYLLHVGYLAYDREKRTCRIPNREIRQEWFNAIAAEEDYKETDRIIKMSKELLEETLRGNAKVVEAALDKSHIHVTSNRSYNNEDALQSAIYLAYIYALNHYVCVKEMTAGKGFADVVYIPIKNDRPALIVELKRNDSKESAIDQIRDKRYFECLSNYRGRLLFVGINYDQKKKNHTAWIEEFSLFHENTPVETSAD